jgi:hypothetical protein
VAQVGCAISFWLNEPRAADKLREISNFLAYENMRVKYVRRGVIRVVKMGEIKILCKCSQ